MWWSTTTSICVSATYDSLKPGDTFSSNSTLCSKQRKFYLDLSSAVYLVINHINGTSVWYYDRNHPFNSDSAVLSLDYSGVLKLEFQDRKPIIIYSSPQPNNNTVATMLDTGNFVLQQLHPNGTKSILWQTFDYPADILIPTMKLGVNRKTGHKWSLVSALTPLLETSGEFSLEWEPKQGELNIKKRGKVYWKSGKLKSNGMFENIPANVQHMYQYIIVSNMNEDSFAFEVKDGKFMKWRLSSKGKLTSESEYGDDDSADIGNADICYGYNSNGGCQKWEDIPTCREPGEVFQIKPGRPKKMDNASAYEMNVIYGYSDCKMRCWRNCSCNGFQEYYSNLTGCVFYSWNSTQYVDLETEGNFNVLVKPTKSAPNSHGTFRFKIYVHFGEIVVTKKPNKFCYF